jgi:tetratricopeptide (TPR) repeat protein
MNKKKKILIIGFLAVALSFIFNTFSNADTNKEYKKYLSSYEQNLQDGKYEDALSSLNSANELKEVDGFSEKEKECETLQSSLNNYNRGVEYFNQKEYKLAVESFKKVNTNDKNYSEAQSKLAESKKLYTANLIDKSKSASSIVNYDGAIALLSDAESTDEVKSLTVEYKDLKAKQEEVKRQEELRKQQEIARQQQEQEAQAKAQQEAQQKLAESQNKNNSLTVYITKTGEKYHRDGCRYLSKSKIPISLSSAKNSYSPCSVCNPPQ